MKEANYRTYLLTVLTAILACNYVDRHVLGIVLQDIKTEFALTDVQLGLLSGIAFALFYALMGFPLARWADRGNRVTIISITTALWSAALALCALAGNFLHLLLSRIAVAIGEAGCMPPAHSLIADHFAPAERPRAVARYLLGGPLSIVIGYFLAGWLNQFCGWRVTLVLLGLPGLGLAALAWLSLKEPRRRELQVRSTSAPTVPTQVAFREVWKTLWASTTFRHLLWCNSVVSFFAAGIMQWQPTFLIRSHGLQTGELGTALAIVAGLGGMLGTYVGGEWATRRAPNDPRLQLKVMGLVYANFALISPLIYLSPDHYLAFAVMAVTMVGGAAVNGPLFAMIQTLVPSHMRATSIAFLYLLANLVGLGLGPLAAGVASDALRPVFGEDSLRYALLALCPGYLWGAWHLWRASATVMTDLRSQEQWAPVVSAS